jgi:integrase
VYFCLHLKKNEFFEYQKGIWIELNHLGLVPGVRFFGLLNDYDIRTVQELFGHKDVKITIIYTHVLNRGGKAVSSLL